MDSCGSGVLTSVLQILHPGKTCAACAHSVAVALRRTSGRLRTSWVALRGVAVVRGPRACGLDVLRQVGFGAGAGGAGSRAQHIRYESYDTTLVWFGLV